MNESVKAAESVSAYISLIIGLEKTGFCMGSKLKKIAKIKIYYHTKLINIVAMIQLPLYLNT